MKRMVSMTMNWVFVSTLLTSAMNVSAYEGGDVVGGGGDASESQVNEIRSDILSWINKGGARGLKLPTSLSLSQYESSMRKILKSQEVVVGFVEKDDPTEEELQVSVKGVPKTCRGFFSRVDARPHILCNIDRFAKTSESAQYRLVHHEYAGLAGIEKNDGAASDYEISTQLTDFLKEERVLRLAIKKNESSAQPCGVSGSVEERIQDCSRMASSVKGSFILVTRTLELKEIWKDKKSGLLWGDLLPNTMTYDNAQSACHDQLAEVGGIKASWQLPTIEEFKEEESNGVRSSLPNINRWFWSSSVRADYPDFAWLFHGDDGDLGNGYRYRYGGDYSVRCVAR